MEGITSEKGFTLHLIFGFQQNKTHTHIYLHNRAHYKTRQKLMR